MQRTAHGQAQPPLPTTIGESDDEADVIGAPDGTGRDGDRAQAEPPGRTLPEAAACGGQQHRSSQLHGAGIGGKAKGLGGVPEPAGAGRRNAAPPPVAAARDVQPGLAPATAPVAEARETRGRGQASTDGYNDAAPAALAQGRAKGERRVPLGAGKGAPAPMGKVERLLEGNGPGRAAVFGEGPRKTKHVNKAQGLSFLLQSVHTATFFRKSCMASQAGPLLDRSNRFTLLRGQTNMLLLNKAW